jgi:nucleoside-diphosphate-sugar epimerase
MDGFKTIGITGAEGFIGKEFSNYLHNKNYKLILFSEHEIIEDEGVRYVKKDLNECSYEDFIGIDVLFHLAGTSFNKESLAKNFLLTDVTLKNAVKAHVKRFFLASSYAVYGDRKEPAKVKDELNPLDEYSLSKILSEYLLKKEILNKSLDGSILRICSIYGDEGKGLINLLRDKIQKNEEINLDGQFERQYLYVKDLCKIFESILIKDKPKLIYNIQGERISSKDIKDILENSGVNIKFKDTKKTSYLCDGVEIERTRSVDKFLLKK